MMTLVNRITPIVNLMIRSCDYTDYSDAYVVVRRTISFEHISAEGAAANNINNKKMG